MVKDIVLTVISITFIFVAALNIWTPYVEGNAIDVAFWFTGIICCLSYMAKIIKKYG
jgi:hypothetical protein